MDKGEKNIIKSRKSISLIFGVAILSFFLFFNFVSADDTEPVVYGDHDVLDVLEVMYNNPSLIEDIETIYIGTGGGGIASYLNDLLDVNASSPSDDQYLYWNNSLGYWMAKTISGVTTLWDRVGTVLSPHNEGDSLNMSGGNITADYFLGNLSCSNIVGGSDADYCSDATGGGGGEAGELIVDVTPSSGNYTYTTPTSYTNNIISFIVNSTTNSTTFNFEAYENSSETMLDTSRKLHTGEWYIIKNVACTADNVTMRIFNSSVDELYTIRMAYG